MDTSGSLLSPTTQSNKGDTYRHTADTGNIIYTQLMAQINITHAVHSLDRWQFRDS